MGVGINLIPLVMVLGLVVGIVVLTLGIRGRPVFTSPHCSKCAYDLRAMNFMAQDIALCPECGAKLSEPGGVNFGRLQRRPRAIFMGLALIIVPWLLMLPLIYVSRHSSAARTVRSAALPTQTLVRNIPANATQPGDWQELTTRINAGSLTTQDVDAVIIALGKLPADTRNSPWPDQFVGVALQRNLVSPSVLKSYLQIEAGPGPVVTFRPRVRIDQPLALEIQPDRTRLGPMRRGTIIWVLTGIQTADGTKIPLTPAPNPSARRPFHPDQLSGRRIGVPVSVSLTHGLPVGEHELSFTIDMGVIATNTPLRGQNGLPGSPDMWPPALATWQHTVKQKVQVVAADQPVVALITDPARDPMKSLTVKLDSVLVRSATEGVQIVVRWQAEGTNSSVPLSYGASTEVEGNTIDLGKLLIPVGTYRGVSFNSEIPIPSLPTTLKTVDVTLTPDPIGAERLPAVSEIWGETRIFKEVPLERFDTLP